MEGMGYCKELLRFIVPCGEILDNAAGVTDTCWQIINVGFKVKLQEV